MKKVKHLTIREFEEQAQEFISAVFKLTEGYFGGQQERPSMEDKALEFSALALHNALKCFLAIGRIVIR